MTHHIFAPLCCKLNTEFCQCTSMGMLLLLLLFSYLTRKEINAKACHRTFLWVVLNAHTVGNSFLRRFSRKAPGLLLFFIFFFFLYNIYSSPGHEAVGSWLLLLCQYCMDCSLNLLFPYHGNMGTFLKMQSLFCFYLDSCCFQTLSLSLTLTHSLEI